MILYTRILTGFFLMILLIAMGCKQPMPTRKIYLPASCPTIPHEATVDIHKGAHPKAPKPLKSNDLGKNAPPKTSLKDVKATAAKTTSTKVDLNQASQTQLETLPGIGPAMAKRILAYRSKRPFRRIAQVRYVKGIGPAKFKKIKPYLILTPTKPPAK